jgi:hypothetical protein
MRSGSPTIPSTSQRKLRTVIVTSFSCAVSCGGVFDCIADGHDEMGFEWRAAPEITGSTSAHARDCILPDPHGECSIPLPCEPGCRLCPLRLRGFFLARTYGVRPGLGTGRRHSTRIPHLGLSFARCCRCLRLGSTDAERHPPRVHAATSQVAGCYPADPVTSSRSWVERRLLTSGPDHFPQVLRVRRRPE